MEVPKIPNNSLTKEITEVLSWCKKLEPEYGINSFNFEPPASEDSIVEWEARNGIDFPESYKDWLRFSNGYDIIFERLSSIKDIIVGNKDFPADLVIIGFTHDDSLCFSKSTHEIVRYGRKETRRYKDFKAFLNETLIRSLKKS